MKTRFLLLVVLIPIFYTKAADFYSTATEGNWSQPSSWWMDEALTIAATSAPTADDTVYVSGIITMDFASNYTHRGDIFIASGGELIFNRQLNFEGTSLTIELGGKYTHGPSTIFETALIISTNSNLTSDGEISLENNPSAFISLENNGVASIRHLKTASSVINNSYLQFNPESDVIIGTGISSSADLIINDTTIVNDTIFISDDLIVRGMAPDELCGDPEGARINIGEDPAQSGIIYEEGASELQICPQMRQSIFNLNNDEPVPTPVQIISFGVSGSYLHWDVNEESINGYEIQHSDDIQNWTSISSIESKGDGRHQYKYKLLNGGYYRLKIVSFEEDEFSSMVYFNGPEEISFYPTVTKSGTSVSFTGHKLINSVRIYNTMGVIISKGVIDATTGNMKVGFSPGVYIVKIETSNEVKSERLIVE